MVSGIAGILCNGNQRREEIPVYSFFIFLCSHDLFQTQKLYNGTSFFGI
jgi:hypothetical protein